VELHRRCFRLRSIIAKKRGDQEANYSLDRKSPVQAIRHEDRYHRCFLSASRTLDDPLTSVLRDGARRLLAQAVEVEAEAFLAAMADERLADGRARLVRHGHGPERTIQTGIGPVAVSRVKLRDRAAEASGEDRITFTSAILPKWARRTKSLDALLPVLYLRGISTGDFQEALAALLGRTHRTAVRGAPFYGSGP
jgi:transposase-like protein